MTYLSRKMGDSSLIKEVLHLVMRLIEPKNAKAKFDTKYLKNALLTSEDDTA